MIIDKIENWDLYPYGSAWKKAFEFIKNLTPDSEEGKFKIVGDQVYAIVMSYDTKKPEDALLETHKKYMDIQVVIKGEEKMEWYPMEGLEIDKPYNPEKDAQFYVRPGSAPVEVNLQPKSFAALFPDDAHMPSLQIDNISQPIKKVVVKFDLTLLEK